MFNIESVKRLGPSLLAYFVDHFLSTWITNPYLTATVMAGVCLLSSTNVWGMYRTYGSQVFTESPWGYFLDICHQLLNLLFIFRFPSTSKKGLLVQSNLLFETLLFVASNVCAIFMISNSDAWMGNSFSFLRLVMWSLIISPYAILCIDLTELFLGVCGKPEKLALEKLPVTQPKSKANKITKLLVDTNNAFLAVFIAQSFSLIHSNSPFLELEVLKSAYRVCCYLFKLHLVHSFVLYEAVVAVFELEDLVAYAELYVPVSLYSSKHDWKERFLVQKSLVMMAVTLLLVVYDAVLMVLNSR